MIHKKNPQINFFWIVFSLNISVAVLSYFVYDFKIEPVLLCILYSFTSSSVRDRMSQNSRSAVRFEIVTEYPEEMSQAIIRSLHHSTTLIPAKGMYSGKDVSILVCVINKAQVAELAAIVRSFPRSFVIMSHVSQVIGNFKKVDSHGNLQKTILDELEL